MNRPCPHNQLLVSKRHIGSDADAVADRASSFDGRAEVSDLPDSRTYSVVGAAKMRANGFMPVSRVSNGEIRCRTLRKG